MTRRKRQRRQELTRVGLLAGLTDTALRHIERISRPMAYPAGSAVLGGQAQHQLVLLLDGTVELTHPDGATMVVEAGEHFGAVTPTGPVPEARAVSDIRTLSVAPALLRAAARENAELAGLMNRLAAPSELRIAG